MKYSLLDVVQDVAEVLDADEVNDIDDSVESRQITTFAKHTYARICETANMADEFTLFSLTASGDADFPVLMTKPDRVRSIEWIKYNKSTDDDPRSYWVKLDFMPLDQFLALSHMQNPDDTDIGTMSLDGTFEVFYRTDTGPTYYTTIDDTRVIFDAIDLDVDTTLQESKVMCYGNVGQNFQRSNSFIPAFDDHFHQLWFEETCVMAAMKLKEMVDEDARRWVRRLWNRAKANEQAVKGNPYALLPNYGRKNV